MVTKYTIEIVNTHSQTRYEGDLKDRTHVMAELAKRYKSDVRMWAAWPVDDGCGCIDYEVEIIKTVKYIERENYAQVKK